VVLVDRQGPGEGTSFGNAGLIQREAVFPYPFPHAIKDILRVARNRSIDAVYQWGALPELASPLLRYWWNSNPERYQRAVAGYAALIQTCIDEHMALAREAEAIALLRPIGFLALHGTQAGLDTTIAKAESANRRFGVNYAVLDSAALATAEPHLLAPKVGAVHWTDALSVSDPLALTVAYARLFTARGGTIANGDATTLERTAAAWRIRTDSGPLDASEAVIALGAYSTKLTKRFGFAPPLFGKRGYHMHYNLRGNAVLNRPMLDSDSGFMLIPMRAGIRLTTGAEFARTDAAPYPVQLDRAEPVARGLLPLADRVDKAPWMGVRPIIPDMLPILGQIPGATGLWCCFGHGHQGLTMGPSTGRLIAEMMTGEKPFVDPLPYRPERF
jgi:D-amino-acid dehydrogenase